MNKYLHNEASETEVNIQTSVNNGSEEFLKKKKIGKTGIKFPFTLRRIMCIILLHKYTAFCLRLLQLDRFIVVPEYNNKIH